MTDTSDGPPSSTMRSLERALDVLQVLERHRAPLRLSEIARASGLHLATTQRILNVLVKREYVRQDGVTYAMGVASLLNAHAYLVSNPLSMIATPVVQELAASTGLAASVSVRVGFAQVLLVRVEGAQPLRYQLPVGEQLPLHLGGARVLAAALPAEEIDRLLAHVGEIKLASGRVVTEAEFRESMAQITELGYAYGVGQRAPGAASIAVPIRNRDGVVIGAIQVSGLEEDFDQSRVQSYVDELTRASAAISRRGI